MTTVVAWTFGVMAAIVVVLFLICVMQKDPEDDKT